MSARKVRQCLLVSLAAPFLMIAQSQNAGVSGSVMDPTGAVVPKAAITLTSLARRTNAETVSAADGLYSFPNVEPGTYELRVTAAGFRPYVQKGITLTVNQLIRLDLKLEVGTDVQTVEVEANASPLNFDNGSRQEGITPDTINELPLAVAGGPRDSSQFTVLLPGVTTGGGNSGYDARINGGLTTGQEAIMDGVSMQEGAMSQTGMVAFADFRMTPDMISEFKVLTSNYEAEYGSSAGAQLIATTKSGTTEFHGGAFEYLRNKDLNATQFTMDRQPGDQRPKDTEHELGFFLGGPAKLPYLYKGRRKTFFFTDIEFFRIQGATTRPTLSIPSLQERQGDFSDWRDSSGNLIPIYDPTTTRPNPNYSANLPAGPSNLQYLRSQFMGCDGAHPNVICLNQFGASNALAQQFFKFLPTPTSPGAVNNYLVPNPVNPGLLNNANHYLFKIDHYWGDKDHFSGTIWRQVVPVEYLCNLPIQLCNQDYADPQNAWVNRFNWDHTFSPTILNHFAYGYLNRNQAFGSPNYKYVNQLPQIKGVPSHDFPPELNFSDGYSQLGDGTGLAAKNLGTRPANIFNDMVSVVRASHTIKFGFEFRVLGLGSNANYWTSGNFNFARASTGLSEITSGSPIAGLITGAVSSANAVYFNAPTTYAQQNAYIFHIADTWKATPKLSINYGLRWDKFTPTSEQKNLFSFFDFGPNPDAGGRPGRLAFAGSTGPDSAGRRYPENDWNGGFAPRLGIAYALNSKTVIRTGYGIFYTQAFYPGWGGGMSQDGINATPNFSSSLGGIQPAFYLDQGFPAFNTNPNLTAGADNGLSPLYRPKDGNRLPYSQQWNFTIERQIAKDMELNLAYVGSRGTRLPSQILPINALSPSYLSMGNQLNDQFAAGQAMVDGVPAPYANWAQQLTNAGCTPSVAQALLPYPQYCSPLTGSTENVGNSTYNSLQVKAEKRYASGLYILAAYTFSKLITDVGGSTQSFTDTGVSLVMSPYERHRNKSIAADDVPHSFSLAMVYELPVGKGKRFLNTGGVVDRILGGWSTSTTVKLSSGTPFYFRSSTCNVPAQFRAACIPGIIPGKDPFLQDLGHFDPGKPLFDVTAFQPVGAFNYYYGAGERITNYRGFGYKNQDFVLVKNVHVTERLKAQIRCEAFNVWNLHNFAASGYGQAFDTDISSSSFGMWNGTVSAPRNIQLVGRLTF
jgi:hypothetical protein